MADPGVSRNRVYIPASACTLAAAVLACSLPAHAYTQSDVTACNGGPSITLDQQAAGCTAIIDSGSGAMLAGAYDNRGNVYLYKGQYDRAIQDYDQAIRLKSDLTGAYNDRGLAYMVKGQFDRAIQDFNETIRLEPDRADGYRNRCWTRAEANRELETALADCNSSLRIMPDDWRALGNRSFVYYRMGRYEDAIADGNAALAKNPQNAEVLYVRGLAKTAKVDEAAGSTDIAAAKIIKPDIAYTYARYGVTPPDAKRSDWVIVSETNATGHKTPCMALDFRASGVTVHSYGVLFMPKGGPTASLQFQFDDRPTQTLEVPEGDRTRGIAIIPAAHDLVMSQRLRARITFVDGQHKDYDVSLVGLDWAIAALSGLTCKASS
jgi:lipoprotein NlpI